MSWLKKLLPSRIRTETSQKKGVPEGLWVKCSGCNEVLYSTELAKILWFAHLVIFIIAFPHA